MENETELKGEARMSPSDVDVLDNLISAQAAYMDAVTVAYKHFKVDQNSSISQAILEDAGKSLVAVAGLVTATMAYSRI